MQQRVDGLVEKDLIDDVANNGLPLERGIDGCDITKLRNLERMRRDCSQHLIDFVRPLPPY